MSTSTLEMLLKKKSADTVSLDSELTSAPVTSKVKEPMEEETPAVDSGLSIPANKTAVLKLTVAEADVLWNHLLVTGIADGLPAVEFKTLGLKDKKALISDVLFSGDKTGSAVIPLVADASDDAVDALSMAANADVIADVEKTVSKIKVGGKTKVASDDPLVQLAKEMEGLTNQSEIETRIKALSEQSGFNDFVLGGLFTRLSEVGDFGEFKSFGDYVQAMHDTKYRKARYLMAIYETLVGLSIPYDEVKHVGWTKLKELTPVLTAENYKDWMAKAVSMNTDSLIAEVKAHMLPTTDVHGEQDGQPVKTVVSKTLKLHPDQLETFNAAVEMSKGVIGTDVDTVAVDHIMQEYLGNAPTKKAAPAKMPTPAEFFKAVKAQFDTPQDAILHLFGDEAGFDELFPTVVMEISFSE